MVVNTIESCSSSYMNILPLILQQKIYRYYFKAVVLRDLHRQTIDLYRGWDKCHEILREPHQTSNIYTNYHWNWHYCFHNFTEL